MTDGTDRIVTALLQEHGRTYAAEAGIGLGANAIEGFRLLCLSLLLSARIRSEVAVRAAIALADHGWATAETMAASTWEDRTAVLNRAGYARYDERTARMLGAAAQRVLDVDGGDLDHLRQRAGYDPVRERTLLQEFDGIGPLGASIFAREAQVAWPELYPYADNRALRTAQHLGLPGKTEELASLVPGAPGFTRLVAALVRCRLARDEDAILALAGAGESTNAEEAS